MTINTLRLNTNAPISILIGENGCGKSQVLADEARNSVYERNSVIAIATSVYDKFPRRNFSKNFHYMGGRLGRFIPREAIKQAFMKKYSNLDRDFYKIFRILEYVNYDQKIGFKLSGLEFSYDDILDDINELTDKEKEDLETVLHGLTRMKKGSSDNILWFSRNNLAHDRYDEYLLQLVALESILKKYKIIKSIEIYLSKDDRSFPLSSASSGELSLISTLVFISSFIEDDTLILIDEPENSLHPKWQKKYISMIMDMFSYYRPSIIAATHSPIVISGLHKEEGVEIHKHTGLGFVLDDKKPKNAEDIYSELFDIITPASRGLSNDCADLLNHYSKKSISFSEANNQVNNYILKSYDDSQIDFLMGIKELLTQIKNKRVEKHG